MEYRILIVEDDRVIAQVVADQLSRWGMKVQCVDDFERVLQQFAAFDPQLVLLDITLPFYSGYYWCGEIRKVSSVPVIFLSSAADNMNIVTAINMGGDDFIAKPFDLGVLTAKVQALLRRSYDLAGSGRMLCAGELMLNLSDGKLYHDGEQLELTRNELRIMELLMEKKGKVVSREALMTRLWESDVFVDENTLAVNMTRLRKKLAELGICDLIHTKKGMGYLIE